MKTLDELRREIDRIDEKLKDLLHARLGISRQVGEYKIVHKLPVCNSQREMEIIEGFTRFFPDDERPYASALYQELLRTSREYQYLHHIKSGKDICPLTDALKSAPNSLPTPETVCHQGIDGSWSSLAARTMYPGARVLSRPTFESVFAAISQGEAQAGIVPIDNTTAGTVNDVYDLLVEYDCFVTQAAPVRIHNCLLGLPGSRVEGIKQVYSHPQALSQCAGHIRKLGAAPVQDTNTAVAAQRVAAIGNPSIGAIASRENAALYGLQVLVDNFNDAPCNQTRFLSVSPSLCVPEDANRLSLALRLPNESGALSGVLSVFSDNRLNLTKIMSRPMPNRPWEYIFYLDCEIDIHDRRLYAVLYQLSCELEWLKLLGCYREALDLE